MQRLCWWQWRPKWRCILHATGLMSIHPVASRLTWSTLVVPWRMECQSWFMNAISNHLYSNDAVLCQDCARKKKYGFHECQHWHRRCTCALVIIIIIIIIIIILKCPGYVDWRGLKPNSKTAVMLLLRITHNTLPQKNGVKTWQRVSERWKGRWIHEDRWTLCWSCVQVKSESNDWRVEGTHITRLEHTMGCKMQELGRLAHFSHYLEAPVQQLAAGVGFSRKHTTQPKDKWR